MDIFIRYKNIYVKVGPHSDWDPKQYRKSVQEFDAATKKFRQGIVDEANKITGGKAYYRSISDYG